MKIKEIISQHRRDFTAIIKCEGCNHEEKLSSGYDDSFYHNKVIPNIKCKNCGKSRVDLGIFSEPTVTKYPDWMQV